jgi:hypothetical protein
MPAMHHSPCFGGIVARCLHLFRPLRKQGRNRLSLSNFPLLLASNIYDSACIFGRPCRCSYLYRVSQAGTHRHDHDSVSCGSCQECRSCPLLHTAALPSNSSAGQLACCMAYQHLTTLSPSTIAALATISGASHRQRLRSVPYSPEHHPRHQLLELDLLLASGAIFGTCIRHNRDVLPDRSITLADNR